MYTEILAQPRLADDDVEPRRARNAAHGGDPAAASRPPAWGQRTSSWSVPDRGQPAWASRSAWT